MHPRTRSLILGGLGVAAALGLFAFAQGQFRVTRARNQAETQLKKGLAFLAAETIDPYRESLILAKNGCPFVIDAYRQARRADRLLWAAQACMDQGIQTPETLIGLANGHELAGRASEAFQILAAVAPKFEKTAAVYLEMAHLTLRASKDADATALYQSALKQEPENANLKLEAMQHFVARQKWADAKPLADTIVALNSDNAELQLLLARVYARASEPAQAKARLAQAQALLGRQPAEVKAALEKSYADVFGLERR
jgi:predicted Zn-dependent protease